ASSITPASAARRSRRRRSARCCGSSSATGSRRDDRRPYLYWPVIYLLVYRPFILPRLSSWDHVPLTLVAVVAGGYVALLLAAGRRRTHGAIALHALGIAL